jgi:preprotein translocase subunit SecG
MSQFALFGASTLVTFLVGFALVIASIFLILLILVQRGRGGGLAGALGGMGGQSAFGSKAGDVFTKITIITAISWIILCLIAIKNNGAIKPVSANKAGIGASDDDLGLDAEETTTDESTENSKSNETLPGLDDLLKKIGEDTRSGEDAKSDPNTELNAPTSGSNTAEKAEGDSGSTSESAVPPPSPAEAEAGKTDGTVPEKKEGDQ